MVFTTATDYISGIQYEGTGTPAISFIQTEEGRALPNGATAYNYEYSLTDHLGNSRVNFDTGTGVARQVQKDDYMPFGMEISRSVVAPKNEYLYNKKELQENLGVYDYGARLYDPIIARWTSVDPLAEKYNKWSPYHYVQNNPIRMIDPDGMGHFDTNGNWVADATDNDTYAYRAQVTANNQTFTWMGKDAGWVAENQQSNSALASMYHGYADNGQDPFQGAYGNQLKEWSQSSAGLREGIEGNAMGLKMAEGVATGAAMVMGPSAGATAGEGFISKMVSNYLAAAQQKLKQASLQSPR